MEIVLGWDELVEIVHLRKFEKAGVTITLDMPSGGAIWMVPGTTDEKAARLYDPEAEEARVMMKVIDDALEKSDALPTGDVAILRGLADELKQLLPAAGQSRVGLNSNEASVLIPPDDASK